MKASRSTIYGIILHELDIIYPNPVSLIHANTTFELLIACILSAQTSDEQVNRISGDLFHKYPDAATLATAEAEKVEEIIRSSGFYRRKTALIIQAAQYLLAQHAGAVPDSMDMLVSIPGIGRKCASVVLSQGFGYPAIIVDRHCARVVGRLGLTAYDISSPEKVESDMALDIAPEQWSKASMLLNYHGRYCCKSNRPECERCPLQSVCNFRAAQQV